jgi:hypothetical protein
MKSDNSSGRASTKVRRDAGGEPPAPQKLNLGCGTLIAGICIIMLLGKFLPHGPRRSAADPAPPPAAKTLARPEAQKGESRRVAAAAPQKPADAPKKPPSPPQPVRPDAAKVQGKPASGERNIVFNNPWNGSVWQVERYLKRRLYDAASFEPIEWGPVVGNAKGYRVQCKFRSKNVLGVYATQTRTFFLDRNGEVYAVKD